jgi:hypothetical protein
MSEPKRPRFPALGFDPPHVKKALPLNDMISDRLLGIPEAPRRRRLRCTLPLRRIALVILPESPVLATDGAKGLRPNASYYAAPPRQPSGY